MKPGIIIKLNGPVNSRLNNYTAEYFTMDGERKEAGGAVCLPSEIVGHILKVCRDLFLYTTPEWVVGVSPRMAKAHGLEHRKRAPGGGRKAEGETVVPLNTWVRPNVKIKIIAASVRNGRSIGEELASRFL